MSKVYVGVVGYSTSSFDEQDAREYIKEAFTTIQNEYTETPVIVSGLTALGIPRIAYEEADKRGWETVGIAPSQAEKRRLYPVNEKRIIGKHWGDESAFFLAEIDVLIRLCGGYQALNETKTAKRRGLPVYEYEL